MLIKNGKVFLDGVYHDDLEVLTKDGKIIEIGQNLTSNGDIIDAAGNLVFAGFVDIHIHGSYERNFGDGEEAVRYICSKLPQQGVTSCLPSLVPNDVEDAIAGIRGVRAARGCEGADPFGIHYEGPYFSLERHASMVPAAQTNPSKEHTLAIADGDLSDIRLMNSAPELPGALEWMSWASSQGIKVEVCYTMASSDLIKEAADNGATQISHLYNGFQALNHRINGPVVGCLLEDRLNAQLTCDGIHVAPAWIKLAIKVKGIEHCVGITDAGSFTGMAEGTYENVNHGTVIIKDGCVKDTNGMLICGCTPWDGIMRACKNKVGLTMEEIGTLYGESPAACLGITDRGKIEVGRKADFTIMDSEFNVVKTIINEKVYYEA